MSRGKVAKKWVKILSWRDVPWMGACAMIYGVLVGCADIGTTSPPPVPSVLPPGTLYPLPLKTFDGSGEAVHPDPIKTPWSWGASPSHSFLVATPYPGGKSQYENPSYYEKVSLLDWLQPDLVVNPIVRPSSGGYLSDPDQLYDPAMNQIWLYYRQVTDVNTILLIRSSDGVTWDTPKPVVSVANHLAISPTVVRKSATDWLMWTVNGGFVGCSASSTTVEVRRSTDGITWSSPSLVTLQGDAGEFPWHIDVTWVPERNEFWAVYNAKRAGSCTTELLRFATSRDGVHWKVSPSPLLQHGAIPEFADVVYRAALSYDAATDGVTMWYSGARLDHGTYVWRLAVQEMSRATMFAITSGQIQQATARDALQTLSTELAVPLTNETAP